MTIALVPAETDTPLGTSEALVHLMTRYQAADLSAAEELVERLSPMLLRFLSGPYFTRNHSEDLLQDCWLQIHSARHTFRPELPLLPWIFSIARLVRSRTYHRQRRIRLFEFAMESVPEHPTIPSRTHSWEQDFFRAMDTLPESQREVVFLQKVCGLTVDEVASVTTCSPGSVKQKAHRAYQTLRKLYVVQRNL